MNMRLTALALALVLSTPETADESNCDYLKAASENAISEIRNEYLAAGFGWNFVVDLSNEMNSIDKAIHWVQRHDQRWLGNDSAVCSKLFNEYVAYAKEYSLETRYGIKPPVPFENHIRRFL